MRFDYELPEGRQFASIQLPSLAVSPDGNQFVYGTQEGLYLRSVNELKATLIAGTEGVAGNPFFSPDGKWIAYFSADDRKLKKISINGGAPSVLCDLRAMFFIGGSWSEDNTVAFGQVPGPVMRVSADGGTPEAVSKSSSPANTDPQFLPGGKYLMYTEDNGNQRIVVVQSLKSGEIKELFPGIAAHYIPTGHIVYRLPDNNNLFAVPFDLDSLEATGGAIPIVQDILQYAVSEAGTLICIPGTAGASSDIFTLTWVDRDGKAEPLGADPGEYIFPKISPDGKKVALTVVDENTDVWVLDLARNTMTRLTFDKGNDYQPIWTRDSREVLFWTERGGDFGAIFKRRADGTGEAEMVSANPERQLFPWALSGGGKTLVVLDTPDAYSQADISMLSMEGDNELTSLIQTEEYIETQPQISPNGKWMAYVSNESNRVEIYVRAFPDIEKGRWQVSTDGGVSPLWAPNGRELFYLSEDGSTVMAVAVETETAFSAGTPKKLFSGVPYLGGGSTPGTPWDIDPDGRRFLMLKLPGVEANESAEALPRKINIFLNWFEELK